MIRYIIPGNPATKKNSQRIVMNPRTHRPMILPSASYKDYEQKALWMIRPKPEKPLSGPVNVRCVYYMQTRRRVDLVNLQEATLDILVRAGVLEDDNCKVVQTMDGSYVDYDKENPRAEIEIEEK